MKPILTLKGQLAETKSISDKVRKNKLIIDAMMIECRKILQAIK